MNTSSTICSVTSETSENSCSVFERNKGFIVRMCGPRMRSGCRLRVFAKVCVFSGAKGPQKKSRGREESSGIIHSLSASIQSFGQPHTENTHKHSQVRGDNPCLSTRDLVICCSLRSCERLHVGPRFSDLIRRS